MAEFLVKAVDSIHPDSDKDRSGCYKKGMPVVVMDDNHKWGSDEKLPIFVLVKLPGVDVEKLRKFVDPHRAGVDKNGVPSVYRRRQWQLRWDDLPIELKSKLDGGSIIIKVGGYSGDYDCTWGQFKSYFYNHVTGMDDAEDI